MELFWMSAETVPSGVGFRYFGAEHIFGLTVSMTVILGVCLLYYSLGDRKRRTMGIALSAMMLLAELFKQIPLIILKQWNPSYLPFHLCSLNIFWILWHVFRPNRLLDNYLYAVCLPAAFSALLFPGWNDLPSWNYISLHSWVLHILLICYPLALTVRGDIKPDHKEMWKVLALLLGLTVFFYFFDECLHRMGIEVNFFFLRWISTDNPVYKFKMLWGSHLYGLVLIAVTVILLMYALQYLVNTILKVKNRKS